jgi:predicted RNA-binding Zn-ribbon protein involved in translation (DUF1610 family)
MTGIDARNPSDVQDGQNVNPQDQVALQPCPFCGDEAEIERLGTSRVSTIYRCTSCGCQLETGEEWEHGRHWNHRPRFAALKAERDTLLADIVEAHGNTDAAIDDYNAMKAERDALQEENDRLREALKPFAEMTDTECDFDIAPHMDWFESRERARAALNKEGAE